MSLSVTGKRKVLCLKCTVTLWDIALTIVKHSDNIKKLKRYELRKILFLFLQHASERGHMLNVSGRSGKRRGNFPEVTVRSFRLNLQYHVQNDHISMFVDGQAHPHYSNIASRYRETCSGRIIPLLCKFSLIEEYTIALERFVAQLETELYYIYLYYTYIRKI